jgi:subtilisin family serine protease
MRQEHGVEIVLTSNSWGCHDCYSQALRDAIAATGEAGMLFVAAAGNDAGDNDADPHYPASYDLENVVAVGATDASDQRAYFSNFGAASVDLFAPGQSILSSFPGDRYDFFSGTSMAAPHVSGAAALVFSYAPEADPAGVKRLLLGSVDRLPGLISTSRGRLDVHRALARCAAGGPTLSIDVAGQVSTGEASEVRIALMECTSALAGASVLVTPAGEPSFEAYDDGVAPDAAGNDGVYTGLWTPERVGRIALDVTARFAAVEVSGSETVDVIRSFYGALEERPFEWIDARSGAAAGLSCDDCSVGVPIGFGFGFYGRTHETVQVSSNGYLTFGSDGFAYQNVPIPSPTQPNALIAPYWDDLNPAQGGGVYHLLEGEAPHRSFTVAWIGVPYYSGGGSATFEVTLLEDRSRIAFQYLDVASGPSAFGASATVGVEDAAGSQGLLLSHGEQRVANGTAIEITAACDENSDGDGTCDGEDNCLLEANPLQEDTDLDGFGNACDQDFDQDGTVGGADFNLLRRVFGTRVGDPGFDPVVDADSDGAIGNLEFERIRRALGGRPGPSGLACAGTGSCAPR